MQRLLSIRHGSFLYSNIVRRRINPSRSVTRFYHRLILPPILSILSFYSIRGAAFSQVVVGSSKSSMENVSSVQIGLDPFCYRQFDDPFYSGTVIPYDKAAFLTEVNRLTKANQYQLIDGYAPFCKHIFVPNFAGCVANVAAITEQNKHLLRTSYKARTTGELPVLIRWFRRSDLGGTATKARILDLILYSREQIAKEKAAMTKGEELIDESLPLWSIISVKAQDDERELPMTPITIMRNSMIEEGGSGVPIDRSKYMEAVQYWDKHAIIADE